LWLYFENGCKDLNKNNVDSHAANNGFTPATLGNRWKDLKRDKYDHNGKRLNIVEFLKSYEVLMKMFEDKNTRAFKDVKYRYDQIKETYPDLSY